MRLADILGHSSIDTTRIYTMRRGKEERRQLGQLCLIVIVLIMLYIAPKAY